MLPPAGWTHRHHVQAIRAVRHNLAALVSPVPGEGVLPGHLGLLPKEHAHTLPGRVQHLGRHVGLFGEHVEGRHCVEAPVAVGREDGLVGRDGNTRRAHPLQREEHHEQGNDGQANRN